MPLTIIKDDITKVKVDAIVNAANRSLLGGGGVDGAIHAAAGLELLEECRTLGGCRTGEAKITKGYRLPAKYVIHTVGPVWHGGEYGERELLISCYKHSLELANSFKCQSVAFPLISSGVYGYPKEQALQIAVDTIGEFLLNNDMQVYIVIFDKAAYQIESRLYSDIKKCIDSYYYEQINAFAVSRSAPPLNAMRQVRSRMIKLAEYANESLVEKDLFDVLDESFSQMLLRKIDEKGITDVQCYKRANIDRKLFSKIRSDKDYHPRKQTALAFAVSLELDLTETAELLLKAGFALSHSSKFDIIVEYFIKNKKYDINEINEALFAFDQKLLGY